MAGRRRVVAIGVDGPGIGSSVPDLRYAQRDAQAVRDVLCDPEIGTFDPSDAHLFLGLEADATEIKETLRGLAIDSSPSDLLLFYFAGHTVAPAWSRGTDVYLVTPDLDVSSLSRKPEAGLRMTFLVHDVLPHFAGTALSILDCCRAGSLAGDGGVDLISFAGRDDSRHSMLAACARDEFALEDPANQHGLLTHQVLRALRGQALDERGMVTFESMANYVAAQGLNPQPNVVLRSRGTTALTRPDTPLGAKARPTPPPAEGAAKVRALESPLDRQAPGVRSLIDRLARMARERSSITGAHAAESTSTTTSRVEYLRSAVEADAVAYLSRSGGDFIAMDLTARFDLESVRHLIHLPGDDPALGFGHVAEDATRKLWCAPLNRDGNTFLAVVNPPDSLLELEQAGAKVLETVWRADFAAFPEEAEIQVLTALRAAFGRLPGELFERCLDLYRRVLASYHIVFQPVVKISRNPALVGVHSYEALARRAIEDQSAPFAMLEVAHTWGDHFVIERDKIIVRTALSSYAAAHAAGPWDEPKPISVNVSVRSLLCDSYVDTLRETIAEVHLDADLITLEIAERDAIEPWPGEQWREAPHTYFHNRLAKIVQDVGVHFAVDDFGVGYASISRAAELPLTQIKVDRGILHHRLALRELDLVVELTRDPVVLGVTSRRRELIVEGVDDESPLTLRQLHERGIRYIQGFITGERGAPDLRPLNPEVREDIAARVRGNDENRQARLTHRDRPGDGVPLRRGA
ncbi:EAL domain-containing protein [Paractinoplanes globisporus]|uniref:EAL domain-containing protein n=1 Tax=Paractinoplanes globisporus TaxID=113565 RepID=A0ABW6WGQ8_9ACTN|nr:EAL domain-containing protein [Actinoplanes globisporus]